MGFYIIQIILFFGGLALFLFGMDMMGKALEQQAGSKLQTILSKMSSGIFKGLFLGLATTAVIQSSSATTVMVVGFVNSGIMTLHQALGIIMGSNIGTTVTAWFLSLTALEGSGFVAFFKPDVLASVLGGVGIVLYLFLKKPKLRSIGAALLGLLVLLTGMKRMSDSMAFLNDMPWFARLMVSFQNPLLGILAGAGLTALIQSSSASVGVLQGLCTTAAIPMATALPIILGQNIGTCVTALLGAVGTSRNARRAALLHLLFNLSGVALFGLLFYGIGLFYPWGFLKNTATALDVAVIHSLFNIGTTLVLLPFRSLLVKMAVLVIPDDQYK